MIPNFLLYPFRLLFSGYFNDDQLASFLTGAFTVGLIWLLSMLQECVPDKFTREWRFRSDNESVDMDDDDDDLSFVDPWNAPLTYVSTQQRRMVRSSISTMADIQKHIGELPKRFERKHWPWETIRRKVLGEESVNGDDNNEDDLSAISYKADDSSISSAADEEKKTDDFTAAHSGANSNDAHDGENENNNNNATKSDVEKHLCIGSIFGLDVGGTLAKLVYFEKKALDLDPLPTRSMRERHYVQAVSAQTIPNARKHGNSKVKRSTSMSPRRNFSSSIIGITNRVRSTSIDELEYKDDEEIMVRNLIQPIHNVRGRLIRRRTVATDIMRPKNQMNPPELGNAMHDEEEYDQRKKREKEVQAPPQHKSLKKHSVGFLPSSSSFEEMHAKEEVFGSDGKRDMENTSDIFDGDEDDDENDSPSKPSESSLSLSKLVSTSSSNDIPNFGKKRSLSMLDLSAIHDQRKAEALDRFYDFARRLDNHEDSISDIQLSFYCRELGGEFHFISFETRKMKNAMDLIRFNNLHMNIRNMGATGGGAHKFAEIWKQELAIGMIKQDELDSLVAGMQFVLSTVVGECFTFRPKEDPKVEEPDPTEDNKTDPNADPTQIDIGSDESKLDSERSKQKTKIYKMDRWIRKVQRDTISYFSAYPYMLVTIGTGVSVLRVDGPRKHERVSGSTIGGGTFWGLMRLLTDVENFEDAMKLAEKGDPTKVDMMVGDIYGKDSDALEKLGLAADIVASSFGKLVSKEDPAKGLTQEDLARALLSLVTNNIGQVAYLNAKLHKTPRIYFVGSFLRHNMISQRRLAYAIDYWSKGEMEALFLEHEGYFGALGAFLMTQNIEKRDGGFFQWKNNP